MSIYRTLYRDRLVTDPKISSRVESAETVSATDVKPKEDNEDEEVSVFHPTTGGLPIWSIIFSPCRQSKPKPVSVAASSANAAPLRLLLSSADGRIRAYRIHDNNSTMAAVGTIGTTRTGTDININHPLQMIESQILLQGKDDLSTNHTEDVESHLSFVSLGSASIDAIRNYVGEDTNAGEEVIASLRLDGKVSIWTREEQPQYTSDATMDTKNPIQTRPTQQFHFDLAVGTTMALLPPVLTGHTKDGVCMLIGCLDGSVALVSTGIPIPSTKVSSHTGETDVKTVSSMKAGTVVDKVGEGNVIPMALAVHPILPYTFSVGRKDGRIDIFSAISASDEYSSSIVHSYGSFRRIHRLNHQVGLPIRALCYTLDGALLISGNDEGHIYIYDTSSPKQATIRLVAAIIEAHHGYVLAISSLPDSKRFVSSSADRTVKVWNVATPNQGPVHTFDTGHVDMIWDVAASYDEKKIVSCGDDGVIQIYSCEE